MIKYCSNCKQDQKIIIENAGPHLKAICFVCRKYVKFLNSIEKRQLEEEEDSYDDKQAMEDQKLADIYWKQAEIDYFNEPNSF